MLHTVCPSCSPSLLSHAYADLVHRWLYEEVGILHRDPSMSNIMYRRVGKKVYGVLTDFDLSSWRADLTSDYTKTSQQRTGTPPFMAYGLLRGSDPLHLYRHDVESLFYVMLILATHYEIAIPKGRKKAVLRKRQGVEELPFTRWFNQPSYEMLGESKYYFLSTTNGVVLSPGFGDFRDWIDAIRSSFLEGVLAELTHKVLLSRGEGSGPAAPPYDNETLGGHIDSLTLTSPAHKLQGKLENLIVRCPVQPK